MIYPYYLPDNARLSRSCKITRYIWCSEGGYEVAINGILHKYGIKYICLPLGTDQCCVCQLYHGLLRGYNTWGKKSKVPVEAMPLMKILNGYAEHMQHFSVSLMVPYHAYVKLTQPIILSYRREIQLLPICRYTSSLGLVSHQNHIFLNTIQQSPHRLPIKLCQVIFYKRKNYFNNIFYLL